MAKPRIRLPDVKGFAIEFSYLILQELSFWVDRQRPKIPYPFDESRHVFTGRAISSVAETAAVVVLLTLA
jgi:hypothetical protein